MSIHNAKNERLERCRVYKVSYTVMGRNGQPLTTVSGCVIAIDVSDLADSIRKIVLGTEITSLDGDGQIELHEVVESVEIISAELVGRLHGITESVDLIINKLNDQEQTGEIVEDD